MDDLVTVLAGIFLIAVLVALRVYGDKLDRQRIREHVEGRGGKVLDISWNPFGGDWPRSRYARRYDVRYSTHRGRIVTATCETTMFQGVWWPREAPPGFSDAIEAPSEPITCLACGAKIPARQAHCPHCGWSYQGRSTT